MTTSKKKRKTYSSAGSSARRSRSGASAPRHSPPAQPPPSLPSPPLDWKSLDLNLTSVYDNGWPINSTDVAVTFHDNKIYAAGGNFWCRAVTIFAVLDLSKDNASWKRLPDMTTPRNSCSIVVLNDLIVVVGGTGRGLSVECYDPSTKKWSNLKILQAEHWKGALPELAAIDEHQLLVTGIYGFSALPLELYDVRKGGSSKILPVSIATGPRHSTGNNEWVSVHQTLWLEGKLIVFGIRNHTADRIYCDCIDIYKMECAKLPYLPKFGDNEYFCRACSVGGGVYILVATKHEDKNQLGFYLKDLRDNTTGWQPILFSEDADLSWDVSRLQYEPKFMEYDETSKAVFIGNKYTVKKLDLSVVFGKGKAKNKGNDDDKQ